MNKTTEALKLAEEALLGSGYYDTTQQRKALAAIREARAEQEKQEPVAWLIPGSITGDKKLAEANGDYATPLYAAPVSAKREWVDLTDDEKGKVWGDWYVSGFYNEELIDRAITAFKEKNK